MNTGIERRYACEPHEWYLKPHGWEERATPTAATRWTCSNRSRAMPWRRRAWQCGHRRSGRQYDHRDRRAEPRRTAVRQDGIPQRHRASADLRVRLRRRGRRPVAGGAAGAPDPGANVLFMTVDLCSLCLRIDDPSIEMFVSAALFGDGAVAVVCAGAKGAEALVGAAGADRCQRRAFVARHRTHHGLGHEA